MKAKNEARRAMYGERVRITLESFAGCVMIESKARRRESGVSKKSSILCK